MRYALICPEDLLPSLVGHAALPGPPAVCLLPRGGARPSGLRGRARTITGDLSRAEFYRRVFRDRRGPVVVAAPPGAAGEIAGALRAAAPGRPIVQLTDDGPAAAGATAVPLTEVGERLIRPAVDLAGRRLKAERIRAHFRGAERVLVLMQDDPDPDAIASGLALRALLGRNRTSAPLCTFGTITRPENLAMCRILDIDVEAIGGRARAPSDKVAMVDVQPSFLERGIGAVDLVIDHHPAETPVRARIRDIRPSYGATSTILVEYLRAAEVKITQRLATALLYGIKADTLGLERGGTRADLDAFAFLYVLANHNALRRIERPELSPAALDALAQGLGRRHIVRGVFFSHLGVVTTVDLIPLFADFGLQAEGVEWSVVSGIVSGHVHVSIRNVGYVKGAGDVARAAFGDVGSAGGHRTMAKAVIPLARLAGHEGADATGMCADRIAERFVRALEQNGRR
jgi:nanoRNase/pAp phosphatase (c-di-AMP/oligoRNAs hydrolase)